MGGGQTVTVAQKCLCAALQIYLGNIDEVSTNTCIYDEDAYHGEMSFA